MKDDEQNETMLRTVALVVSVLVFLETLLLWARFDPASADFQFVERHAWIPAFGISYFVGVDGISLLLLVLTGFLTPLALLGSWESVHKHTRAFCMFVLLLESAMMGVFVSLDLFLFYVFWDAMLIPMYFLIGIWGYERRVYAAVKFILYTMAGSVLMLLAILGLAYLHSTATRQLQLRPDAAVRSCRFPANLQFWFFLAFALSFAIKVPLFPFHTWLPDAHVEAPTAGSVILAGVLLKMGTYGLVRFAFPLFPLAASYFAPYLAVLAVVGIIYGALVAMVQPDMKKLVAYSSVSHLGFVVLGIAAMNVQGVQGAVYQMLNHGVSTGGLFLIVGMLSDRRHTRLITEFGGLKKVVPRLVAAFLIITLSSIGLPGLNGFVGEFLILLGAFRWDPRLAAFAATGVDPVGRLHAVDVPAGELRTGDQREERGAARSEAARMGRARADRRGRGSDGRAAESVPATDGAVGRRGWSARSGRRRRPIQASGCIGIGSSGVRSPSRSASSPGCQPSSPR